MSTDERFHILTVGWDSRLIDGLCTPIESMAGLVFTHGVISGIDAAALTTDVADSRFIRLGFTKDDRIPLPDHELLASIECPGVPTVRTMILGDRVLRNRRESEALGYVTLLTRRFRSAFLAHKPDLILGSFDQAHGMLGLAVAKSLGIPWVTMSFSVIPENLVGFCWRLTPNSLIAGLGRPVTADIRRQAREVMERFRSRKMNVLAFRPATSLLERVMQMRGHGLGLARRLAFRSEYDKFIVPTIFERISDIVRRNLNALVAPTGSFLRSPASRPYVFFPLQMKPEMSTDTQAPFFQDQIALVRQLADAIPIGFDFIVKLHISDPDNYPRNLLTRLRRIPGLKVAHPSARSFSFLERASLVVGITGTPCLEAALLGKPVLLFGDSPYVNFPHSERAKRPDDLVSQIRRMLNLPSPSDDEIVDAYAAYLARYLPGRINDWGRPIEPHELQLLADCFRALRSYADDPVNRADWYKRPPFVTDHREVP